MAFYSDMASNALRRPAKPAPNAKPSTIVPYVHSPGLNPSAASAYTKAAAGYLAKPTQPAPPPVTTPGGTPPTQTVTTPSASGVQGSSLPYAGVYLEQQNAAEKAYENAQTQLSATRNALYHRYGLLDNGAVDPYSQYGDYQTMLAREGGDLDAAREDAVGRGLGSGGLARQAERSLRFAQGSEQLDFKNKVLGADSDYRTGLAQALAAKNDAFRQAEEQANQDALQKMLADGYFTLAASASGGNPQTTGPGPGDTTTGGTDTPTSSTEAADALARYLANQGTTTKKKSSNTRKAV